MLRTEADVVSSLKMLSTRSSWNPNAKFLVFVDWLERDWRAFLLFIIQKCWSLFLIDVVICIPTNETTDQTKVLPHYPELAIYTHLTILVLQILTWFPYDYKNCEDQVTNIVDLGACHDGQIVPTGINLFPEKVLLNCSDL